MFPPKINIASAVLSLHVMVMKKYKNSMKERTGVKIIISYHFI
ncbi:hypothetical protein BMG_3485 [Priestia megaterium]|nr:hypothetical protein BMG_3485 [Priestia megaterium]